MCCDLGPISLWSHPRLRFRKSPSLLGTGLPVRQLPHRSPSPTCHTLFSRFLELCLRFWTCPAPPGLFPVLSPPPGLPFLSPPPARSRSAFQPRPRCHPWVPTGVSAAKITIDTLPPCGTKQTCAHGHLSPAPAACCPLRREHEWGLAASPSCSPGPRTGLQRWGSHQHSAAVALDAELQLLQMLWPPSLLSAPSILASGGPGPRLALGFQPSGFRAFLCDITCPVTPESIENQASQEGRE